MDALQFCYWLQGHFEINQQCEDVLTLYPDQVKVIKDQLKLVFTKVIPVNDFKHPYQGITIQPQQLWPTHMGT